MTCKGRNYGQEKYMDWLQGKNNEQKKLRDQLTDQQ